MATFRPMAVITGASHGIGYELAQVFAKNNFDLIVTAEDAGIVEAAEAFRVFGGNVDHIQTNLAAFKGVDALFQKIKSMNRPIDTVVFNTGSTHSGDFTSIPMEEELDLIQLNVTAVVHLAKHIVKDMLPQKHGRLLFTSSLNESAAGYSSVYAATRSFVQSFAEHLRFELNSSGIVVMAIQQGSPTAIFSQCTQPDKKDIAALALEGFNNLMATKSRLHESSQQDLF